MTGDDKAYLFYLILLLIFISGSFLYSKRESFSQTMQQALIWVLIFVGAITAYGFKDVFMAQIYPSSARINGAGSVTLSRANDGHFYASLNVNGRNVEFVIDTGATAIVLSKKDAETIGINTNNLNYMGQAYTANGVVRTAFVELGVVKLGNITDYDLPASVNGGELFGSLLGMDYLNLFSEFKINGNTLTLTR
jgi:aspartyl protease family protein